MDREQAKFILECLGIAFAGFCTVVVLLAVVLLLG